MILVSGGAGYIGSHLVKRLLDEGHRVIVFDNLSTGHPQAIDRRASFMQGDLGKFEEIDEVLSSFPIEGIIHLAAKCYVRESVLHPLSYYQNNVVSSINLFSSMLRHNIKKIIFSSSCAVYGVPKKEFIDEDTATLPVNPYGRTKLMVEHILKDLCLAYGLQYVILRYFNVAGAEKSGEIGEDHTPETHLIPIVLKHLLGFGRKVSVYGRDYHTHDGTCIRDYIHVSDLSNAHAGALALLLQGEITNEIINLGQAKGYSILEVIRACENISGKKANIEFAGRREGDPQRLVTGSKKAYRLLNWQPEFSLDDIIKSAWRWHATHPHGYEKKPGL